MRSWKDWPITKMSHITLPATLRISKYMWLMFALFFINICILFYVSIF